MKALLGLACLMGAPATQAAPSTRVLLMRKGSANYEQVATQLKGQLPDRQWDEWVIDKSVTYAEFEQRVRESRPALAVLMDNEAVDFALRWNAARPAAERLKGVALMALNLKAILKGNRDIVGVAFESPIYSMMTQFRYLLDQPVRSVAVLFRRSAFGAEIAEAARQLKAEGITLREINVEAEGKASLEETLREQLRRQAEKPDDALWVPLDSALLTPHLFSSVWRPAVARLRVPVVIGAENLVSADANFGTFAVTPDLRDLAGQAAQIIESVERGASPAELGVEDFLGVRKILNLERARSLGLKVRERNLGDVEVIP